MAEMLSVGNTLDCRRIFTSALNQVTSYCVLRQTFTVNPPAEARVTLGQNAALFTAFFLSSYNPDSSSYSSFPPLFSFIWVSFFSIFFLTLSPLSLIGSRRATELFLPTQHSTAGDCTHSLTHFSLPLFPPPFPLYPTPTRTAQIKRFFTTRHQKASD